MMRSPPNTGECLQTFGHIEKMMGSVALVSSSDWTCRIRHPEYLQEQSWELVVLDGLTVTLMLDALCRVEDCLWKTAEVEV